MTAKKWNMIKEHFPNKRFYLCGESPDDEILPTEENVRIQSAAPEAIEALKAAIAHYESDDSQSHGEPVPSWVNMALAVIAKAGAA